MRRTCARLGRCDSIIANSTLRMHSASAFHRRNINSVLSSPTIVLRAVFFNLRQRIKFFKMKTPSRFLPTKGQTTSSDHSDQRHRVHLAEIDEAKIGWAHIRAIAVAGTGFFTDAYDLFSANFICVMIGLVYYKGGVIPTSADAAIKLSTTAGAVVGQVLFGWLADKLGRKKIYGIELMIILAGTFGQAICGAGPGIPFLASLIFWRVLMGIGVGGDYPLSSVITSEFATVKWRGALMNSVFGM